MDTATAAYIVPDQPVRLGRKMRWLVIAAATGDLVISYLDAEGGRERAQAHAARLNVADPQGRAYRD